jgi:hypothetical protein
MDPGQLPKQVLDAVEADSFWCLTKLLDGIQDNYISHQPGIQRQVASLRDLTTRIDDGLAKHLQNEGVEFIQFSFRWMNCLLMREISVKNTIRMWDTYLVRSVLFSISAPEIVPRCANELLGGRGWVLIFPSLCVRCIPCQMVRPTAENGLPGNNDVPAGIANTDMD